MAPRKRVTNYPIFETCLQYTIDPYWCGVFGDFVKGKFPKGMVVSNDTIYFKRGTKTATVSLQLQSIELFQKIITALQDILELRSHFDRCRNQNDLEAAKAEINTMLQLDWTKIRKKKFKDDIILSFAEDIKHKYRLRFSEMKQLLRTINSGLTFHQLNAKDFNYIQGRIVNIEGLYWDPNSREFYTRDECSFPKSSSKKKPDYIDPYSVWSSYVEKEVKNYKKFNTL